MSRSKNCKVNLQLSGWYVTRAGFEVLIVATDVLDMSHHSSPELLYIGRITPKHGKKWKIHYSYDGHPIVMCAESYGKVSNMDLCIIGPLVAYEKALAMMEDV